MHRRHFLGSLLTSAVAGGFASTRAFAQAFPSKTIRIIASSAPGGGVDLAARMLSLKYPTIFGQPTIVENRAGAAGYVGTEYAAMQPADGYTLLVVASSHTTNRLLNSKLARDPIKDFTPISLLTEAPFVLAAAPTFPPNNIKEFVAYAKQSAKGITYSTTGVGQGSHLGMELLRTMDGFKATPVAYTGVGPAATALLSNVVDVSLLTPPAALQSVKTGGLKAYAVTSKKRLPALPDVPTLDESGYPGYELLSWIGLLGPANMPRDVVAKLYDATVKTFKEPDVLEKLAALETSAVASTPEEFTAFLQKDVGLWEKIIEQAGVPRE